MRVLITGGAGFIGSHLVNHHLRLGDSVYVVDDLSTGRTENLDAFGNNPRFQFSKADILTWENLIPVVATSDRIYHMAAVVGVRRTLEDPVQVVQTNISGTDRILRAIQSGGNDPEVIIASSSESYGFNTNERFKETDNINLSGTDRLRWCYAVTKLADEFIAYSHFEKYNLKVVVVRLFNTIGPRQLGTYGMVVPNFIKQAVADEPITVFSDGNQTRSFCDVRDTVVALDLLAGNSAAWGEVVNVGDDQEISIKDLAEMICERAGSKSKLVFIPYGEAYGENFTDISRRRPCLEKLTKLTGFKHRWELAGTIDDLILRAKAQYGLSVEELEVAGIN
jgi:UDP-glucose 4-epimerase